MKDELLKVLLMRLGNKIPTTCSTQYCPQVQAGKIR